MITGLGLPLQDDDTRRCRQFSSRGDPGDTGADDDDVRTHSHIISGIIIRLYAREEADRHIILHF